MDRKERREPEWAGDEQQELAQDAEIAARFGFRTDDITAARHDLVTFLWTFHNNPFDEFENLSAGLKQLEPKLNKNLVQLEDLVGQHSIFELAGVLDDMRSAVDRLRDIRVRLPRRPHSIQSYAVRYLMAFWTHVERVEGYSGSRKVIVGFNGDKPTNASMRFLLCMLDRAPGVALKGIGRSTISRARGAKDSPIPHPTQVNAFEGDPSFM